MNNPLPFYCHMLDDIELGDYFYAHTPDEALEAASVFFNVDPDDMRACGMSDFEISLAVF